MRKKGEQQLHTHTEDSIRDDITNKGKNKNKN